MDAIREISLPESDYLKILDLIKYFHDSKTKTELRECFKEHLLPFFDAHLMNVTFFDPDYSSKMLNQMRAFEFIGFTEREAKYWTEKGVNYLKDMHKLIFNTSKKVAAVSFDYSIAEYKKDINKFFEDYPEYRENDQSIETFPLQLIDRPDMNVGVAIFRTKRYYSAREVRIMELLHPHIMQAVRSIALKQELNCLKAITNSLINVETPIAVINKDYWAIFQNPAFSRLVSADPGKILPHNLRDLFKKETQKLSSLEFLDPAPIEFSFYESDEGIHRLSVTHLNLEDIDDEGEGECWLLKLKPVIESYCLQNLMMQGKSLTRREMEICYLVKDGMTNQEIAKRLFISLGTVKNHIKSIHKKLEVSNRGQLVANLNR